jgi:hypothetical protein
MSDRDMVNRVFARLAEAPTGLDCSINQVLAACGMLVTAILREGFSDPAARQNEADRFSRFLQRCVNPSHDAIARRH